MDKGLVPLPNSNNESWCQGLDGLAQRTAEYYKQVDSWRQHGCVYSMRGRERPPCSSCLLGDYVCQQSKPCVWGSCLSVCW